MHEGRAYSFEARCVGEIFVVYFERIMAYEDEFSRTEEPVTDTEPASSDDQSDRVEILLYYPAEYQSSCVLVEQCEEGLRLKFWRIIHGAQYESTLNLLNGTEIDEILEDLVLLLDFIRTWQRVVPAEDSTSDLLLDDSVRNTFSDLAVQRINEEFIAIEDSLEGEHPVIANDTLEVIRDLRECMGLAQTSE